MIPRQSTPMLTQTNPSGEVLHGAAGEPFENFAGHLGAWSGRDRLDGSIIVRQQLMDGTECFMPREMAACFDLKRTSDGLPVNRAEMSMILNFYRYGILPPLGRYQAELLCRIAEANNLASLGAALGYVVEDSPKNKLIDSLQQTLEASKTLSELLSGRDWRALVLNKYWPLKLTIPAARPYFFSTEHKHVHNGVVDRDVYERALAVDLPDEYGRFRDTMDELSAWSRKGAIRLDLRIKVEEIKHVSRGASWPLFRSSTAASATYSLKYIEVSLTSGPFLQEMD